MNELQLQQETGHLEEIGPPPPLAASDALYLDFDGTLADFAPRPDQVVVSAHLTTLLTALAAQLDGAVAVVTGRELAAVDALLAPVILPGAGLHGAELRLDPAQPTRVRTVRRIVPLARALRQRFGKDRRLLIENKTAAVALHYRLAPERAQECIDTMRELASRWGLDVMTGSMVVEARPRGANKGHAVRILAAQRPFCGRRPVFVGDDRTDEDGFAAAAWLDGYGVKVGPGRTLARYRCDAVEDVRNWLRDSLPLKS
jgi:trehalose 6-phosphate phosphatase